MRPSFQPRLVNDPFSDPGLFIPFLFEKRALMFDLGDLSPLSPKDLLKITHVFVTHTHMDHFIGFDTLLRTLLGREKTLHLFGPPGFFQHVEGKLAGYTWNLVSEYDNDFTIEANEVHLDKIVKKAYRCQDRFKPKKPSSSRPFSGTLLEEPSFSVHGTLLEHRIPCLGLALFENFYINIIKEGLKDLGLPVGPWLNMFKAEIYQEKNPQCDFVVTWVGKGKAIQEKRFTLGELVKKIARISPGQKIVYITDVIGNNENARKIVELANGANLLFIEAAFLESEREMALKKYHLTAREAGELARKAGVNDLHLFHFSPRYKHQAHDLEMEAREAFNPTKHQ
jgi:ribonuclease Z